MSRGCSFQISLKQQPKLFLLGQEAEKICVPERTVVPSYPLGQKTAAGCSAGYRHCEDMIDYVNRILDIPHPHSLRLRKKRSHLLMCAAAVARGRDLAHVIPIPERVPEVSSLALELHLQENVVSSPVLVPQ